MSSHPSKLDEESSLLTHKPTGKGSSIKHILLIVVVVVVLVLIAVGVVVTAVVVPIVLRSGGGESDSATFSHAAVAADAAVCSTAGVDMLKKGGSAVDAAIAAHLCLGVVNLHSTGIGGGGFMVYYNATSNESIALDYRDVAPLNSNPFMYNGTEPDSHIRGGLSIAVPGELRGLEYAWERFGVLSWEELFEPAIRIATEGIPISKTVADAIAAVETQILSGNYDELKDLLAPDGKILVEGDILKRPALAETLNDIAVNGSDYFYSGDLMEQMVKDIQDNGGIITEDDFEEYVVRERNVTKAEYKGLEVLGISAPGGGPVLGLILNILDEYDFEEGDLNGLSIHRMVEAMKFTYAQRLNLGDPTFNDTVYNVVDFMLDMNTAAEMWSRISDNTTHDPDYYMNPFEDRTNIAHDHGTSHLSVLAANGDAVSMTNSVNNYFGSLVRSEKTGIIFNDLMADFSIPGRTGAFEATEVNYIQPGKRPLSSMTPSILINEDKNVEMVVGASGGARITTSVAQVILNVLGFELPLSDSIDQPRLHHQLIPNFVSIESDYPEDIVKTLEERGHEVVTNSSFAVVQGIHVVDGLLQAKSDPRKGGIPDGY